MYHLLPYVKGERVDVVWTKQAPPLAKRYHGTPKETVYTWKGPPPEELTLDMGIVDVIVTKGKKIRFERVPSRVSVERKEVIGVATPIKEKPKARRIKYPEPEKLLYADIA